MTCRSDTSDDKAMTLQKRRSLSLRTRFAVLQAGGFRCHYCGKPAPEAVLQVDHVLPRASGGPDTADNYVASCSACNGGKGAIPLTPAPNPVWTVVAAGHPPETPHGRCMSEAHVGPLIECVYPLDTPAKALMCDTCKSVVAMRYLGVIA